MRSILVVSGLLFLPLLAGCLTEPSGELDQTGEVEPEPEPEPWTRRLFLLFPDPCPEEPVGTTTYNTSMEATPSRQCGKGVADIGTTPPPCAVFHIHDPEYRIHEGQTAAANITMETGPGPDEVRLVWMDDDGMVAEATDQPRLSIGRGFGGYDVMAAIERDSTTGLRFEVHAEEELSCGRVSVGSNGGRASAIWVIED